MKKIKSYSKINLFLKVYGKVNRYHQLYSLISQINLYDEISIRENSKKKNYFYFSGPFKIRIKDNTISKLLELMKKEFQILRNKNFNFYIKKNIPSGSGLGGASSNATAIFSYLVKKYQLKISRKKSLKILDKVGKDCALFINQKTKLIQSSGSKFYEYKEKLKLNLLIIYPNINLPTAQVFKRLKSHSKISKKKIILSDKIRLIEICKLYGNDLLQPALGISSRLGVLLKLIQKSVRGDFYSMTGSGSAFFIISHNKKSLLNIKKIITKQRNSFWTKLVKTV